MFKKLFFIIWASVAVVSCRTLKPVAEKKSVPVKKITKTKTSRNLDSDFSGKVSEKTQKLIKDAEKYLGVRYKYAGNTSSGFDCSGFTCKVFEESDYKLPRTSSEQSETGINIDIKDVKPGDLLFFSTFGGNRISHVGIVHNIENNGEVKFIHASTSKGIVISSLNEEYWNKTFVKAKRIF